MEVRTAEAPWHPDPEALQLSNVLKAFADPTRLAIVARLAEAARGELSCREVGCATKQLTTHHLRILREAGVTATREDGRQRFIRLRREAIDVRFPGLLDTVLFSARTATQARDTDSGQHTPRPCTDKQRDRKQASNLP